MGDHVDCEKSEIAAAKKNEKNNAEKSAWNETKAKWKFEILFNQTQNKKKGGGVSSVELKANGRQIKIGNFSMLPRLGEVSQTLIASLATVNYWKFRFFLTKASTQMLLEDVRKLENFWAFFPCVQMEYEKHSKPLQRQQQSQNTMKIRNTIFVGFLCSRIFFFSTAQQRRGMKIVEKLPALLT